MEETARSVCRSVSSVSRWRDVPAEVRLCCTSRPGCDQTFARRLPRKGAASSKYVGSARLVEVLSAGRYAAAASAPASARAASSRRLNSYRLLSSRRPLPSRRQPAFFSLDALNPIRRWCCLPSTSRFDLGRYVVFGQYMTSRSSDLRLEEIYRFSSLPRSLSISKASWVSRAGFPVSVPVSPDRCELSDAVPMRADQRFWLTRDPAAYRCVVDEVVRHAVRAEPPPDFTW